MRKNVLSMSIAAMMGEFAGVSQADVFTPLSGNIWAHAVPPYCHVNYGDILRPSIPVYGPINVQITQRRKI